MSGTLAWLEKCPLPLAVVDGRGLVLYWSTGAEWLTGHPRDEAVGRLSAWDLALRPALRFGIFRQLITHGFVDSLPVLLRDRSDRPKAVRLSVAPMYAPSGQIAAFLLTFSEQPAEHSAAASRR